MPIRQFRDKQGATVDIEVIDPHSVNGDGLVSYRLAGMGIQTIPAPEFRASWEPILPKVDPRNIEGPERIQLLEDRVDELEKVVKALTDRIAGPTGQGSASAS